MKNTDKIEPSKLPFFERLQITWDFESTFKSLWLTGYLLFTWRYEDREILDFNIAFYSSGSYE